MRRGTYTTVAKEIKAAAGDEAVVEFESKAKDIKALLVRLENGIKKERLEFKRDPTNWGYVGDLGHVQSSLKDLVDFLRA